jgi:hypothetical protein
VIPRFAIVLSVLALAVSAVVLGWNVARHKEEPPVVTIWPQLTKVPYGATVKIHWRSYHAATCQIQRMWVNHSLVGWEVPVNGSYKIGPLKNLTVVKVECDTKVHWYSDGTGESLTSQDIGVIIVNPPKV